MTSKKQPKKDAPKDDPQRIIWIAWPPKQWPRPKVINNFLCVEQHL